MKIIWKLNGKKLRWPPRRFPGIPAPLWEKNESIIKDIVSRHKLIPVKQEIIIDGQKIPKIPPWWKYGGPWPHLHLGNDIYFLDKNQWNEISRNLTKEIDLKLRNAKQVSFMSFME